MSINSLTFDGHSYLDNIRDPEVWKKLSLLLLS
ncbi:DUF2513 domain-containing protein [Lactiplantibacillus pentosus]|uniref:DUF2513 domain-containing protein n=1 Tax=Lactiplantibacillus pentosus TaxID=1589 RepID=A0AAX6L9X4_LACPE|nr:DUF2513 domain-containing protein [Lactiplantibacillus pentosus]MCJ8188278.1 DUF2513 domain-containing protein [Lactiplantibacillus pentosus]MDF2311344.1 DUF2513 domain-containing protein [Lactiplantibacillus pentosus]USR86408.1 DUF2513 domain-containing protein [Lactiplantibacillus pentosus]UZO87277.1 DUF2513 domain-containing protein [Lactiplantibacillus pentosus]WKF74670.1 DUF2513 domain-containing protein [Lactiplantibacillus pentosus]